eukprot:5060733-Amphidinium_carterae.1
MFCKGFSRWYLEDSNVVVEKPSLKQCGNCKPSMGCLAHPQKHAVCTWASSRKCNFKQELVG